MTGGVLHVVVPGGIDDPARPSGGNTYDRRLCAALPGRGRTVRLVEVEGGWPWSADLGAPALEGALAGLPDGATVLVDGLLASRLPSVMLPASRRLRVVLLLHLPVGVDDVLARLPEQQVVMAAAGVVTPSDWCRDWLLWTYDLDPRRVVVARPGVDRAAVASGTRSGASLLTVGAVSSIKGQDHLLAALADLRDLAWTWTCVGSLTVEPEATVRLRRAATTLGVADRILLAGPLGGADLEAAYADADLLVLPSRTEAYGMVLTEAIAHGLPVVATDVGGVREALGESPTGSVPGLVVRPGDPADLASALRRWLTDHDLRALLRSAALERRSLLDGWSVTAGRVAEAVREVAA
ncbi:glycosyltransferase family 4 protein [Nocardioides sp.]|uniref:glycosyltransferase family 4 protein n=1 Tax=Nocardioides sp. TaxID=35761 RepID=UPI0035AE93E0